jgi:hypothetical protein
MTEAVVTVATPSSERILMHNTWQMISDIRSGIDAVKARGSKYLPKYEAETEAEYQRRLESAPWRPEFNDALAGLVSRPFSREILLKQGSTRHAQEFADDVDRQGNNITSFARQIFLDAMSDGLVLLMVDYPDMSGAETAADDIIAGARPYFVRIRAQDIIALYTSYSGGKEKITHVRIKESHIVRSGFSEVQVNRVRVLEPGKWELWEQRLAVPSLTPGRSSIAPVKSHTWERIAEGRISRNGIEDVPIVTFWLGERKGFISTIPPLYDLAHMQMELYRAGSRKDENLTYSGAAMLAVIGSEPPEGGLKTGPRSAIFISHGEGNSDVKYVQPDAASTREIREDYSSIITDMRRLAMQPITQKTTNITAKATSVDEARAHSVLQSWVSLLADSINSALSLVSEYSPEIGDAKVLIHTDFGAGSSDSAELASLNTARKNRDISNRTYLEEMKRRNVLGPQFIVDDEPERVAEELEPLDTEIVPYETDQMPIGEKEYLETQGQNEILLL